jgi:PKD repeat protein
LKKLLLYTNNLLLLFVLGTCVLSAQPVADFSASKVSGCSPLTVDFVNHSTGSPTSYAWDFDNGNTSTFPDPSATYVNPGTYTVSLKAVNSAGTNTKTMTITVFANPVAKFKANPISGCSPLTVNFADSSTAGSGAITQWQWDFGDGGLSSSRNPAHVFNTIDSFTVSLIVTDANGCQSSVTKTKHIKTSAPFIAEFTATGNIGCVIPATVNFGSTVAPLGAYSYFWNFGDGFTSTLPNPAHTYSTSGNYTVIMEVTSANGCKTVVTKPSFVMLGDLTSLFTYSLSTSCAPAILSLTNASGPNLPSLVFIWKLNGGQDKYSMNPNYLLTTPGPHQIMLVAKNLAGCLDTSIQTITLNPRPDAGFITSKNIFCSVPAMVQFTDTTKGTPTSWTWNFGNSVVSTNQNPLISYTTEGTYPVRLIASRGGSCSDTAYTTIRVGKPNVIIQRKNQKKGCVPLKDTFELTDLSLIPMTSWRWELGSTVLSTATTFSHTFNDTGIYVIKLTGSNAEGCTFVGYDTVRVGAMPQFDFTADKFSGCYNKTEVQFTFQNLSAITPDQFEWDFGNKQQSREVNPLITFTDTGVYYVKLKVSHKGCSTEVVKPNYITIYTPIARWDYKIDECSTDTVKFTNNSAGKNRLLWRFGDGATSTDTTPVHNYPTPGAMEVWLITEDTVSHCRDSISKIIDIVEPPNVKFTPNDTMVCADTKLTLTDKTTTAPSRTILSWFYELSDGRVSTQQHPQFVFTNPGWHRIKLTVKDNKNCEYSYDDTFAVKVFMGLPRLKVDRISGCSPMTVNVGDSSSIENPTVSRKWLWGNGDSVVSTTKGYAYTYNTPSTPDQSKGYIITMVVTDSRGCIFTDTTLIRATRPIANYSAAIGKSCGRDTVKLASIIDPQTLYGPGTYKWWLPAGISTVAKPAKFILTGDSTYAIKFQLTDANGCIDTITKNVKIDTRPPQIGFDASPRNIPCYKSNTSVAFTDQSIPGGSAIIDWKWTFGDNTGADTSAPSKIYFKPGRYPVTLTIKDSAGCVVTQNIPDFLVVGGPYGSFTFSPRRGCNPVEVFFSVSSPNAKYTIWDHADGNVDTIVNDTHSYIYDRPGVYYPRITLQDSSESCELGYDAIDSIVVFPLPNVNFDANLKLICKNSTVLFNNLTNPRPYPIYVWKWTFGTGDSSILEGPVPYTYGSEGRFKVTLEATDINGCTNKIEKDSFIGVNDDTVPPQVPLVKRATVQNNEEVLFEYHANTDPDFEKYIIYTDLKQVDESDINVTSYTETGLNTLEFPYAYKISAVDICHNQSAPGELHRTVELKVTPGINAVELNWTPYSGFDNSKMYEIWRRKPEESSFSQLTTVHGDSTHYTDTATYCHQLYFYQVKTAETDSLMQTSWSDTSGAEPEYVPLLPVPENIRATVENNRYVRMEWHRDNPQQGFYLPRIPLNG